MATTPKKPFTGFKHTAGPWRSDNPYGVGVEIRPSTGGRLAHLGSRLAYGSIGVTGEEEQANGMLIAESPQMLETLIGVTRALQRVLDQYNPDSIESEWIAEANESVFRATGYTLSEIRTAQNQTTTSISTTTNA
jgi:hypothetical protein